MAGEEHGVAKPSVDTACPLEGPVSWLLSACIDEQSDQDINNESRVNSSRNTTTNPDDCLGLMAFPAVCPGLQVIRCFIV